MHLTKQKKHSSTFFMDKPQT